MKKTERSTIVMGETTENIESFLNKDYTEESIFCSGNLGFLKYIHILTDIIGYVWRLSLSNQLQVKPFQYPFPFEKVYSINNNCPTFTCSLFWSTKTTSWWPLSGVGSQQRRGHASIEIRRPMTAGASTASIVSFGLLRAVLRFVPFVRALRVLSLLSFGLFCFLYSFSFM